MRKTDKKILLFTGSYPYSSAVEDTFIDPELPYLKSSFNAVIIIPKSLEGKKKDLPTNITVETTLGELLKLRRVFKSRTKTLLLVFTSLDFYKEILRKPKKTLKIRSIIRIISYLGVALRTKKWILRYIENNDIDLTKTIFYTYWLDEITMGICLAKIIYPEIKIISRAHGIDFYEERSYSSYIPFRPEIFQNLNKVYIASRNGQKYLSNKYPLYKHIFEVATLSIRNPNFIIKQSEDNIFRIVTCSFINPIKRIELLIYGLKKLGELKTDHQFCWIHIGNGPQKAELEKLSQTILPKNINYRFLGYLPNAGVINFYKNNPIDVFINVSQSEGGNPVSIMEAQSCGIPVIASAVGGNKEIVSDENGLLLNENPTSLEIANAICKFLDNETMRIDKKYKSHENWLNYYNSEKRCQLFVQGLIKMLKIH